MRYFMTVTNYLVMISSTVIDISNNERSNFARLICQGNINAGLIKELTNNRWMPIFLVKAQFGKKKSFMEILNLIIVASSCYLHVKVSKLKPHIPPKQITYNETKNISAIATRII